MANDDHGGIMYLKRVTKPFINLLLLVLMGVSAQGQIDQLVDQVAGKNEQRLQEEVVQKARGDLATYRQFIADSLRLLYGERLVQKLDSLESSWEVKYSALQEEQQRLSVENQRLLDSLQRVGSQVSAFQKTPTQYDQQLEAQHFRFLKILKAEVNKKKGSFLSGQGEDISPFQVEELQNYYDAYYPFAHSDSVLDFLAQLWIRQAEWTKAELAIIKFLFLYPSSPLYEEMKNIRSGIFQTEKYFRPYQAFLNDFLKNIPTYDRPDVRYFRFIETLKDFPDPALKDYFLPEARRFLTLYPRSPQAPQVNLWVADAYLNKAQPHRAYLYYLRTIIFYPQPEYYRPALFACGIIQQEKFTEYENAISTFFDYYNRFPNDTVNTQEARYRIALIFDKNLKNWDKAIEAYSVFADKYPRSERAIIALQRIAEIQQKELGQIDQAVATLKEIQKRYPTDPSAPGALIAAGDLLVKKLLFESAIETYRGVVEKYPQSEQAPLGLEKIMDLYTDKMKDNDKALEIANLLVTNYPTSRSGAKASKLIKKLEKVK